MCSDFFLPRLRLLRYCLRQTLPSWLGVTWPTSRATAVLSPSASMPTHTDCTFSTSTDTWRGGVHENSEEDYGQHHQLWEFTTLTMSRIYFLGLPIISSFPDISNFVPVFPKFLATHYIFRGIVGALGGCADGVGRHAPLLLMTSRCLRGALGGTLFADGVLEAWDGHVICTVMKDTEILLTLRRHTLDFAFYTLQTFPCNTVQCEHSGTMLPPSGQCSFLPLHVQ